MRDLLAACILGLCLGVGLGLFLVTLGDVWASFDPTDTPALVGRAASGFRAIRSHVRDLIDNLTTARHAEHRAPSARLRHDQGRSTSCAAC